MSSSPSGPTMLASLAYSMAETNLGLGGGGGGGGGGASNRHGTFIGGDVKYAY